MTQPKTRRLTFTFYIGYWTFLSVVIVGWGLYPTGF